MIISYRRIWPHMPIFSSMLWLNRQYPKVDELLWVEWSSGRIIIFTRTESGNLRNISKHISFKKSKAYKSEMKIMCKKGIQKNSLRNFYFSKPR
jgi:hypothetical protein